MEIISLVNYQSISYHLLNQLIKPRQQHAKCNLSINVLAAVIPIADSHSVSHLLECTGTKRGTNALQTIPVKRLSLVADDDDDDSGGDDDDDAVDNDIVNVICYQNRYLYMLLTA
ncbi:unnamed protein product [Litomosoides sigmodontis]|uniref:Uncharacterized protein n=1 Tax=Litomosoides sigmodontis TaxID=42156 RepID=A0A3P7K0V6_LITSI|nr:unnamed protein product [Litomosoides sigmodontis]